VVLVNAQEHYEAAERCLRHVAEATNAERRGEDLAEAQAHAMLVIAATLLHEQPDWCDTLLHERPDWCETIVPDACINPDCGGACLAP
jgi:hypothetical protein